MSSEEIGLRNDKLFRMVSYLDIDKIVYRSAAKLFTGGSYAS